MLVHAAGPGKAEDDAILPLELAKQKTMLNCRWTGKGRGRCYTAAGACKVELAKQKTMPKLPLDRERQRTMLYCLWSLQSRRRC